MRVDPENIGRFVMGVWWALLIIALFFLFVMRVPQLAFVIALLSFSLRFLVRYRWFQAWLTKHFVIIA